MESIGSKIKYLRESANMTQAQLARQVKVAPVTVSKWELEVSKPKSASVKNLSDFFNVTVDTFLHHTSPIEYVVEEIVKIPFYDDVSAAAGCGCFVHDENHSYVHVPKCFVQSAYNVTAIMVSGDSMMPVFNDGACIFVDSSLTDIVDGKVFVVLHEDMLRVKILRRLPNGVRLESYNKEYPDEIVRFNHESFKVIGRVIGQIQKYS